jgi:hypothetical protein
VTDLSDALTTALAAVSTFKGETLTYRTTHTGSTSALTGFVLHRDRVPQPSFLSERQAEAEVKEATCKGPLTPALAIGYEIVDGNSEAWLVESVMKDSQQICRVKRVRTISLAPDRGQTR